MKKIKEDLNKRDDIITIASPVIVELVSGASLSHASEKEKEKIHKLLNSLVTLKLDKKSAFLSGEIEADLIKKGSIIGIEDIMIAAIAKQNNQNLLTRNVKHFSRIKDLKIETY